MTVYRNRFPGIYYKEGNVSETNVPSIRKVDYLYEFFDRKLDKKFEPNTVYVVDAEGNQKMMSIDELVNKSVTEILKLDAPADGKQYTRQDHEWKEKISAEIDDYTTAGVVIEDHTGDE